MGDWPVERLVGVSRISLLAYLPNEKLGELAWQKNKGLEISIAQIILILDFGSVKFLLY